MAFSLLQSSRSRRGATGFGKKPSDFNTSSYSSSSSTTSSDGRTKTTTKTKVYEESYSSSSSKGGFGSDSGRAVSKTGLKNTNSDVGGLSMFQNMKPVGGGTKGNRDSMGSVSDRMAFFRQAAEKEKKEMERKAEMREKMHRTATAPASLESTPPRPPIQKKESENSDRFTKKKNAGLKRTKSISSTVLEWCQDSTRGYKGVNIKNFSGSWASGLAFCALIHKYNPHMFNYDELDENDRERNFTLAFETAEAAGIPSLLDVEDMVRMSKPEPRSVQCYVQMIWSKYRPKDQDLSGLALA